jgi:hypothetical protein
VELRYELERDGTPIVGSSGTLEHDYDGEGSWCVKVQLPSSSGMIHAHVEAIDTATDDVIERWHGTIRATAFA